MWRITGPFESEQSGDETSEKAKLLKPGGLYGVGRHKDSALTINNKKISRKNGEFIVGEHSEDDVLNAAFVPTLSLRNNKSAAMKVSRGDNVYTVNPESTYELESGDVIRLAGNVNATVIWDAKVCFYAHGDDIPVFDLAACAAIGVKLVTQHSRDVTHHITASITAPAKSSILLSLLNPAFIVSPQWLVELIYRGNDVDGLEKSYELPLESSYHPLIDPAFEKQYPSMGKIASWNLNWNRKNLFEGVRFIFVVIGNGNGSSTKAMSDVVTRGGADRQLINVEREAEEQEKGASGTWGTVLKKRKLILKEGMRSALVLVGDEETMTAKGVTNDVKNAWGAMVEKAKSVNMRVINPSLIAEAVFRANALLLDCTVDEDTDIDVLQSSSNPRSLPECIPSTLPEEISQLPGTESAPSSGRNDAVPQASQEPPVAGSSRRLTRRAGSQRPSPEPAPPVVPQAVEDDSQNLPKRLLKRRAKTGGLINQLLGLDETTILEEPPLSQEQPVQQDAVPATPARPGRLRRRAGNTAANQVLSELLPYLEDREEPTLKKFKALFEESGQGGLTSQTDDVEPLGGDGGDVAETQLGAVVEEEEEEEEEKESQGRGLAKKRKANAKEEDRIETGRDVEMRDAEGPSTTKKRAIEAVNAVERSQKPVSRGVVTSGSRAKGNVMNTKKGAAPGKPDTDPSFLRAIASNKRGKRLEDDFDREFNRLRIAKPVNTTDAPSSNIVQEGREWDGLDDLEKDMGIQGNFMQIVELKVWKDVEHPERNIRRESGLGARLDWDGREDFKRFRRKINNGSREVVKLALSGQQDYGSEAPRFDYRGNRQTRGFDDMSQSQSQSQGQSYPIFTQTPSGAKNRTMSQPKSRAKPKAIHEAIDDDGDEEVEVETEINKLGTQPRGKSQAYSRGKPSRPGKKKSPLFELDSEEDLLPEPTDETLDDDTPDLTLRSSKGTTQSQGAKGKTRGTKRKITLEDESDSDHGLTFGGFSKKAKRK